MFPLPKEFDESRFVGQMLYEIAFNANQIRLFFSPNLSIVVEGEIRFRDNANEELSISPQSPKLELLQLLESTVESTNLDSSRSEMELRFKGDIRLSLLSDDNYESYRIDADEKSYLV
jgi:hypothetical protein